MTDFPRMADLIPASALGLARVDHFDVSEVESAMTRMRQYANPGRMCYVPSGRYAALRVGGHLVMSDTAMERESNQAVVEHAHGKVLVAGLGLGMILLPILAKPEVARVTVVEVHADVVDLIAPHFASARLDVVVGDIFEWVPPPTERYDAIYFDIWPAIKLDNIHEINALHRKFRKVLARDEPPAWMGSWAHDVLKRMRR